MSDSVLMKIAERTRLRVAAERARVPAAELERRIVTGGHVPAAFAEAFVGSAPASARLGRPIRVLAEIKFASPSEGEILPYRDPAKIAGEYLAAGASALSILTEPEFFKGSLDYLAAVRKAYPQVKLLMKDFLLDEYQLLQARAFGADCILLIVAMLGGDRTRELLGKARGAGLSALVEVHSELELDIALQAGASFVGINNRDLKTLKIDLAVSERLAAKCPEEVTLLSESGIRNADDLRRLAAHGFGGFLIGSSLMRTGAPGKALGELLDGAKGAVT